jgi:hypothetical protein
MKRAGKGWEDTGTSPHVISGHKDTFPLTLRHFIRRNKIGMRKLHLFFVYLCFTSTHLMTTLRNKPEYLHALG